MNDRCLARTLLAAACVLALVPLSVSPAGRTAMTFSDVTPNLIVSDVEASIRFYRDVLSFSLERTVPEQAPRVFAWLKRDDVSVFLNDMAPVREQLPSRDVRIGHTSAMFIVMSDIDEYFETVKDRASIAMPLTNQFYGMREFVVADPDGYLITFAEPIAEGR